MRVLIAGCGYLGRALGARLAAEGAFVAGLRRPGSDPAPLRAAGVEPFFADLTRPGDLAGLPRGWDGVVFCAAPDERGEAAYRAVYAEGSRRLVEWLGKDGGGVKVFTGSTRVYAQADGSEVTEASPTEPRSPEGRVLLEAEAAWRGAGGVVFRVAGLYGPGRNRIGSLVRGEARMHGAGERRLNLIHRDDLVAAVILALRRARPGALYNVSDGRPPTEREFYGWLCPRLGVPLPGAAEAAGGGGRRRSEGDKQVMSGAIREALGWRPAFPDFRGGYAPLLETWGARGEA